ncbi:ribokinase [Novilysobacter antarcticus]|uniref:ribokinase n=1 Tax=Novilysobacter antarcticus TaxID=2862543 RepID=UPI001C999539|nr:ribokinase [Lysobacter antarcticus]
MHAPWSAKVVVIGSFNIDHVWALPALPQVGQTLVGEYHTGPGGKGFNQATACARAGAATAFVCSLGTDAGSQIARELAHADGITLHVQASDAPTGTAGIYVDAAGCNTIVIGPGANASLSAGFISEHAAVLQGAAVMIAQLESPPAAVEAGFRLARDAGAVTVLNPAPADARLGAELLALSDVITPNETEFCAQLQRHQGLELAADGVAALDGAQLHRHCRDLLPAGSVIITLGAAGCFVSHPEAQRRGDAEAYYRVAASPAKAIDTTGAGDAFNGALVASMAQFPARAFARHVAFATAYAGRATEQRGAAAAMPRQAPPPD